MVEQMSYIQYVRLFQGQVEQRRHQETGGYRHPGLALELRLSLIKATMHVSVEPAVEHYTDQYAAEDIQGKDRVGRQPSILIVMQE